MTTVKTAEIEIKPKRKKVTPSKKQLKNMKKMGKASKAASAEYKTFVESKKGKAVFTSLVKKYLNE